MLPVNDCLDILQGLYQQAISDTKRCVRLLDFEKEMRNKGSAELKNIEMRCCGFICFMNYCLRTEPVFNAFYELFGYGFVFVEAEDYRRNGFDGHECNECSFIDPLFLLVEHNKLDSDEHQAKKVASLRLEDELFKFYENNAMTPKTVRDRNQVINKISAMIQRVWPDLAFKVDYFGSTRTHLASDDSDLDIAIVVSNFINSRDAMRSLRTSQESVFNMHFLGGQLRNIGMIKILPIQNANVPICKFTDPGTGLRCDINASGALGLENSQLIDNYRQLDKRVGPFLYALKYFVKRRNINDNQKGTLSSYAYCLLGIYYLMNHDHDSCIIPNLQNFKSNAGVCQGLGCKFTSQRYFVESQQVRYHDCIEVVSESKYQVNNNKMKTPGSTTTRWEGYCLDNLGEIMLAFFKWASKIENLTEHMSIRHTPFDIPNPDRKWFRKRMVIQDPFIQSKNVAQSCSSQGLNKILTEFERAAKLLEETDTTFIDMCNSKLDPPYRSTAAIEFPITIKPQHKRNQNRFRRRIQNDSIKT